MPVVEEDGVSNIGRFYFDLQGFANSTSGLYVHCQVGLCEIEDGPCISVCSPRSLVSQSDNESPVLTGGPIIVQTSSTRGTSGDRAKREADTIPEAWDSPVYRFDPSSDHSFDPRMAASRSHRPTHTSAYRLLLLICAMVLPH
ncbi:uncharacterized protein LOC144767589 [Lissotriton helveticus]